MSKYTERHVPYNSDRNTVYCLSCSMEHSIALIEKEFICSPRNRAHLVKFKVTLPRII